MENIFTIIISDFHNKIHFLNAKPSFNYSRHTKFIKHYNKSICSVYHQERQSKNIELKIVGTTIDSRLSLKVSIIGEIIIDVIYDASVNIQFLNMLNQRLTEALFLIAKTKKIKIEMLNKKYNEVNSAIEDMMYLMDPRLRLLGNEAVMGDVSSVSKYYIMILLYCVNK